MNIAGIVEDGAARLLQRVDEEDRVDGEYAEDGESDERMPIAFDVRLGVGPADLHVEAHDHDRLQEAGRVIRIDVPEVEELAGRVGQLVRLDAQVVAYGERHLARQCERVQQAQPGVQVAEDVVFAERVAREHVDRERVEKYAYGHDGRREIETYVDKH